MGSVNDFLSAYIFLAEGQKWTAAITPEWPRGDFASFQPEKAMIQSRS